MLSALETERIRKYLQYGYSQPKYSEFLNKNLHLNPTIHYLRRFSISCLLQVDIIKLWFESSYESYFGNEKHILVDKVSS